MASLSQTFLGAPGLLGSLGEAEERWAGVSSFSGKSLACMLSYWPLEQAGRTSGLLLLCEASSSA